VLMRSIALKPRSHSAVLYVSKHPNDQHLGHVTSRTKAIQAHVFDLSQGSDLSLKLFETRPPLTMPTKFTPHPITKPANIQHKSKVLAINFHQWEGYGSFLETKSIIPGFTAECTSQISFTVKVVPRLCLYVHDCRKATIA